MRNVIVLLVVGLIGIAASGQYGEAAVPTPSDILRVDTRGETIDLALLQGQVVVLFYWLPPPNEFVAHSMAEVLGEDPAEVYSSMLQSFEEDLLLMQTWYDFGNEFGLAMIGIWSAVTNHTIIPWIEALPLTFP